MTDQLLAEAQQVLDDLLQEGRIPFNLRIGLLLHHGCAFYTVRFLDSRLRDVDFDWMPGESFGEVFRAALLGRMKRMNNQALEKTIYDLTKDRRAAGQ